MEIRIIALAMAAAAAAAMATAQEAPPAVPPAAPAVATQGTVIMYRGGSVMGAALGCPIRYQGREIVELGRGKFAAWAVPAGRYILTNHTSSVEVAVDPGETRYVRCLIGAGFLTGRANLQIVDRADFEEHRIDYEQKPVAGQ